LSGRERETRTAVTSGSTRDASPPRTERTGEGEHALPVDRDGPGSERLADGEILEVVNVRHWTVPERGAR
jgi:hypothetical protein